MNEMLAWHRLAPLGVGGDWILRSGYGGGHRRDMEHERGEDLY
jgi:hypothetical protein